MRKSGVAVDVTVDDGISAVHGNRRLLEHALVNLLVNAADACEEGGSIAIHAHQEESTVRFDVVDDGIGIPSEQAARIPQIFFTTKAEGAGSGLGLAIVQEIARGHHGGFSIEPVVPHGTRASIWLPAEAP
jgi:signal transduction histidine kinase